MKKVLFTALIVFAVSAAAAQTQFDVRAGISASALGAQHLKMGFRGGFNVGYLFDGHFGVRTGLHYSAKGASTSNDVFENRPEMATRLSYLDLPVEAMAAFRLTPRTRLEIHAGPYFARLLHAKLPATAKYEVRHWDVGIGAGADISIGHFIVGPEVQYGLTKAVVSGAMHNITYSLTLGYRF